MCEQKPDDYGIECSIEKRQVIDDEKFLKSFIPFLIHDDKLDDLNKGVSNCSYRFGKRDISYQNTILGFKYNNKMYFTANILENKRLLNFILFNEDSSIELPYLSMDLKDPTVYVGDNYNKLSESAIDNPFYLGIYNITQTCHYAKSSHYYDKEALGTKFWQRKRKLDNAITNQMLAWSKAVVEHYEGQAKQTSNTLN